MYIDLIRAQVKAENDVEGEDEDDYLDDEY